MEAGRVIGSRHGDEPLRLIAARGLAFHPVSMGRRRHQEAGPPVGAGGGPGHRKGERWRNRAGAVTVAAPYRPHACAGARRPESLRQSATTPPGSSFGLGMGDDGGQ